jgi:ATP synthase protein I
MLASYALIIRRSAAVTAAAAAIMVLISTLTGGGKGALGALLGTALVAIFFAISVVAVARAAKISPQAMMITALSTYLIKILLLLFFVVRFANTTAFSARLFGLSALVAILVWSGSQVVWSLRLKTPYVEPYGEG